MKKAPIAFFAYKRPEHTLRSLESLAQNEESAQSELFIFCDSPKLPEDWEAVKQVRKIVRSKHWCSKVHVIEREENWGLARSIISGVTELCTQYGRVIVLEDDLIFSSQFLKYMNDALERYEDELKVFHISGYMFPVKVHLPETFFLRLSHCWGWATWQRAWQLLEQDASLLLEKIRISKLEKKFAIDGSYPFMEMLEKQQRGEIDSWAVRWYASVFLKKGLCLYPYQSFVMNTGFDGTGTHCDASSIFNSSLLQNRITSFSNSISENRKAHKALVKYFQNTQYSPPNLSRIIITKLKKIYGLS